jgi:hypothetical protein
LRSNLGGIRSATSAIVNEVDRALRAAARIASPSRMTAEIGRYMGEGLAAGMLGELGHVSGASIALAAAAIPDLASASGRLPGGRIGEHATGQSYTPPAPYRPIVVDPMPARSRQRGANQQGDIHVHLGPFTVQGNVTAEDDLKLAVIRAVREGIVEGRRQQDRAMGVTWEAFGAVPGWPETPRAVPHNHRL